MGAKCSLQHFYIQHIVFAVKFIIALVIPDVPSHVKIAESRVCNYTRKGRGDIQCYYIDYQRTLSIL